MKNREIISFFQKFSPAEMKELGRFIEFKSKQESELNKFFDYLKKYHPSFPEQKINKIKIAQKLFPQKVDEDKINRSIDNLIFRLKPIVKDFLIYSQLKKQEVEREFLYLNALKDKKLSDAFFAQMDKVEKKWRKNPKPGIEHPHNLYKLKRMRLEHPGFFDPTASITQSKSILLLFEKYYFIGKLYWTLSQYYNSRYSNDKEDNKNKHAQYIAYPIDSILSHTIQNKLKEDAQIELLQKIANAVLNEDYGDYKRIEQAFFENHKLFNKYELDDLVACLTQICYENHRQGNPDSLRNLFEINKFAVEQKIIIQNGGIATTTFHNIVNIAYAANEIDWIKEFIDEYEECIEKNELEATRSLWKANHFFYNKEYQKAADLLLKLNLPNIFYNLQKRALLLMVYFEMEDGFDLLDKSAESFKKFLSRNKDLASIQKEGFKNFIYFILKLYECQFLKDKKKTNLLQKEVSNCSRLVYKSWLSKKLVNLEN